MLVPFVGHKQAGALGGPLAEAMPAMPLHFEAGTASDYYF